MTRAKRAEAKVLYATLFLLLFYPSSCSFFGQSRATVVALSSLYVIPFFVSRCAHVSRGGFGCKCFLVLLVKVFYDCARSDVAVPLYTDFLALSCVREDHLFQLTY